MYGHVKKMNKVSSEVNAESNYGMGTTEIKKRVRHGRRKEKVWKDSLKKIMSCNNIREDETLDKNKLQKILKSFLVVRQTHL